MTPAPGSGQSPSPPRLTAVTALPQRIRGVRTSRRLALSCCGLLLLAACGTGPSGGPAGGSAAEAEDAPQTLRVGLIPNIAPDEQRARYARFGDHLAEVLDREVELFVATSYAGVVTALANGRLDVAYLGGVTYVQAEQQVELDPLVTEIDRETGTTRYLSAIVVRDDAPFTDLDDVLEAGGVFAMGDVASTSGSLYPRIMLVDAGADCSAQQLGSCPPLEQVVLTGGHDAAAQAVLQGSADAAGLELRILRRLERDGAVPRGDLRVLQTTEVEGYPWVARAALPQALRDDLIQAFLTITDEDLLDLLRADGYEPVTPADYDEIRTRSAELGLLEQP